MGAFLAALIVVFNIYMGLKTGWGAGGSILAAILGFAIIRIFTKNFTILENNLIQTMASAGGSIGNIVNVIPAIFILYTTGIIKIKPTGFEIFLWIFFTSFLGVFFAIPLRKQIVEIEKLKFPTGTACAQTLVTIHKQGAGKEAKTLGVVALISGIITWFRDGVPALIRSAIYLPGKLSGVSLKSLTVGMSMSPMMFGAGFLIGPRVGLSMFIGAVVGYLIIAPWIIGTGIVNQIAVMMTGHIMPVSYGLIVKWTMWPALGLMIAYGIAATALKLRIIVRAFRSIKGISKTEVPLKWISLGVIFCTLGIIFVLERVFGVKMWVGLLVIPIAFILSTIAVRATGETDINPVGSMGSVTQILFGAVDPTALTTLLTGGVAASAASESADMMQDLKTGYLVGANPKKQTIVQLLGVFVGAIVAVPIFMVLIKAYGIGSEKLPAPAAITWSGLATMMSKGAAALPKFAAIALVIGSLIGVVIAVLEHKKIKYLPSAVGLGVALIVPAIYSVSMFLGSFCMWLIDIRNPAWIEKYASSIGAGAIAGEGLVGVLVAILIVLGLI